MTACKAAGWQVVVFSTPYGLRFADPHELERLTGAPVRSEYRMPGTGTPVPPPGAMLAYFADDAILYNPRLRGPYRIESGITLMRANQAVPVPDEELSRLTKLCSPRRARQGHSRPHSP